MMKVLLSLCLSITTCLAWSQPSVADSTTFLVGAQTHFGRILAHSESIKPLTDNYMWGFQADVSRLRHTKKSWNTCNCYSQNGLSFSYFNYNNPRELGSSMNVAVFAEPQLTYGKSSLSFRAAAGISYLTRVYHPADNPRNLFFSNPWSGLLQIQLTTRYPLGKHWRLRGSGSYSHVSNGGSRQPNKGMNFPTVSIGLEYSSAFIKMKRRAKKSMTDKSVRYGAGMSYNTRSVDASGAYSDSRRAVMGLHGGAYKPVSRMHGIGLGLEAFLDHSLKERARQTGESLDHHIVSGLISHHFLFGHFDFMQSLGIYFYKGYPTPDKVFQRYSIYYRLLEKFQVGFSLKAHVHTAEQMDVRLRFLF